MMFKFFVNFVTKNGDFSPFRLSMLFLFLFAGITYFLERSLTTTSPKILLDLYDTTFFLFKFSAGVMIFSAGYDLYKSKQS